ncbi:MAG: cyclic nucleotide-binding domain-containing protein [Pseudomonadales bacterium]
MSNLSEIRVPATTSSPLRAVPFNNTNCHRSTVVHCNECCMKRHCLAASTDVGDLAELETLIEHWHPMPKERHVMREGDRFNAVFLVRSGSVKTYQTLANGEELITGFYFPGEIFGLDGLADKVHVDTAVTMETTSLCSLPLQRLLSRQPQFVGVEQRLLLLLSELLNRKDSHSSMLSKNRAHERLAAFLLDLSHRFERRRLSSLCFSLPMSRTDVSHYLGLSLESVSRAFGLLEKDRVIKPSGRVIEIIDSYELESLAGVVHEQRRQLA